jgi:hypothetical protein
MSPKPEASENANSVGTAHLAAPPRVVAAANENEVMLEQLEYLIEHAQGGTCGCAQCERYLRVRSVIMEVFADGCDSAENPWWTRLLRTPRGSKPPIAYWTAPAKRSRWKISRLACRNWSEPRKPQSRCILGEIGDTMRAVLRSRLERLEVKVEPKKPPLFRAGYLKTLPAAAVRTRSEQHRERR